MGLGLRQNGSGPVRLITCLRNLLRAIKKNLLHTIFPDICMICRVPLGPEPRILELCPDCSRLVVDCRKNTCRGCGAPAWSPESCCCRTHPDFDAASAPFVWTGPIRDIVLSLKYSKKWELAGPMSRPMLAMWRSTGMSMPDLVVPVPIGISRFLLRGYNQASLLASEVASVLRAPCDHAALKRRGFRRSTKGRGRLSRKTASLSAFEIRKNRAFFGKTILLVDDVMTTGATASACARCLKAAGASRVEVLTFARAVLK